MMAASGVSPAERSIWPALDVTAKKRASTPLCVIWGEQKGREPGMGGGERMKHRRSWLDYSNSVQAGINFVCCSATAVLLLVL